MGLKPDGIAGHSLGEVACGYMDGCLSHEEAVLAAYWRGQCIKEANVAPGAMAAVGRHCLRPLFTGTFEGFHRGVHIGQSRNPGPLCIWLDCCPA